jgi:hypothetical protein
MDRSVIIRCHELGLAAGDGLRPPLTLIVPGSVRNAGLEISRQTTSKLERINDPQERYEDVVHNIFGRGFVVQKISRQSPQIALVLFIDTLKRSATTLLTSPD